MTLTDWKYQLFEITKAEDYNEYVYFYPHAQKALFNRNPVFEQGAASYCFKYNTDNKKFFNIHIKDGKHYILSIDSITLTIFDTGIGILKFGLENHKYKNFNDILIINDYGRRIYPQFLGDLDDPVGSYPLDKPREKFYPLQVEISSHETSQQSKTSDSESSYYNNLKNFELSKNPTIQKLPKYIENLFGKQFKTQLVKITSQDILITPVIDDRMFVMCVYGDSNNAFDDRTDHSKKLSLDMWFQFLFMDGHGKGAANPSFEHDLIREHSYDRWIDYGTRYGISRYSFVALVKGSLTDGFPKTILTHCKTMYLRSVLISLTQRASVIRFSEEIAHISALNDDETDKISALYKHYIQFVNKYHFNEVTAQEQGIEIYSMIQSHMRIKENLTALREEISDLHAFADLISEKKRVEAGDFLNRIVVLFLIPTFITGFLGMNTFSENFFEYYDNIGIVSFLRCPATGYAVYIVLFVIISLIALIIGYKFITSFLRFIANHFPIFPKRINK